MKKTETHDDVASAAVGLPQSVVGTPLMREVARPIPNPPGGGSWTWDEAAWTWISNDPVVETAVITQE